MIVERATYKGNPNIGVYLFVNDKLALVPLDADDKFVRLAESVFQVPAVRVTIADTSIIGVLVAGNNKGVLLPHLVREGEYLKLRAVAEESGLRVGLVKSRFTALGNVCLANDRAALLHPEVYEELKHVVSDVLEVETVERGTIGGVPTVGSAAYVNNVGGLVHPDATDEEVARLSEMFRVRFEVATVNFGVGFIRSGLAGNTKGLLVGDRTTGPEVLRIIRAFGGAS